MGPGACHRSLHALDYQNCAGTARSHGAFYDVAYDRVYAPPSVTTGNGLAGGKCTLGKANGTTSEYDEGIDINQSLLNGGAPGAGLTDGGVKSIDAAV
ncbi:MAG TPA: hypothetical protein VMR62_33370 [Bryobacteraceae bacterium]|nr:hypothetical protein [Bryobacteraceae bacterium]